MGRAKNFRRDGDVVRADLHIDPTAHKTPDGDLAGYVMTLAQSDPDAFGSSMVIYWEEEFKKETGKDGKALPPYIRVKKLMSVDVVDDPAANDGLFGMPFFSESVKPSAEITAFLDKFLNQPEAVEKVISFLQRYGFNRDTNKEEEEMFEEITLEKLKAERSDVCLPKRMIFRFRWIRILSKRPRMPSNSNSPWFSRRRSAIAIVRSGRP